MTSNGNNIPIVHSLSDVYPIGHLEECQEEKYKAIESKFIQMYGTAPEFYVRAPGRVNLIGEHIDYEGYSVLPMAIAKEIILAVSLPKDGDVKNSIQLANMDNSTFPACQLPIDPTLDIDLASLHWGHYFQCGYKGAWLLTRGDDDDQSTDLPGGGVPMNILAYGNVPLASGLSSSSAFVVASTIASIMAAKRWNAAYGTLNSASIVQQPLDAVQVADLCRVAEQFIGTMSGGMDQAISCLGKPGIARLIQFNPLRSEIVRLPENLVVVIADSLTKAEKAKSAKTHYNKRVVECMLASKLIAQKLGLADWKSVRKQLNTHRLPIPIPILTAK